MQIVVAQPARTSADVFARVFQDLGCLKRYVIWARRLPPWLRPELAVMSKAGGALRAAGPILLPSKAGESWQYLLHPLFGGWAARHVEPGDWVFSSFGYCNEGFAKARKLGGVTMANAGNSHPQTFWDICSEEHERWGVRGDPILKAQHRRALAMVDLTDYFFCPSSFVRKSYLARGIPAERLLTASRTVDLSVFRPAVEPRRRSVFRIVCPATVSLRKGTVYLLQAFERFRREFKDSELVLNRPIRDGEKVMAPYAGLVTWQDPLPARQLANCFQTADVFVLATLEEGLARTGLEAMACGLPVIVTTNSGVNDFIREGVNGYVVPIRDPNAIYEKLVALATQPELRRAMGAAAAETMLKLPNDFAEKVAAGLQQIQARETGLAKSSGA